MLDLGGAVMMSIGSLWSDPRWAGLRKALVGGTLLLLGIGTGWTAVRFGLLTPLGVLIGLAVLLLAFFRPAIGLRIAVLIAVLLPFAVLPVRLGFTPTFLELALFGFLAGWLVPPLMDPDRRWRLTPLDGAVWPFVALTGLALLLSWGRGLDAALLHSYAKLLLGLLAFFGLRQVVRREAHRRRLIALLLLAAGLAALLGLLLHALPDSVALDLLTYLGRLGYPTTGRVLRYVEDDPSGLERAIGTAVDPNSFGGMLALAAAVATGELLAAFPLFGGHPEGEKQRMRPLLPRPLLVAVLLLLLAALYLTYSRAAAGGVVVAVLFLAAVRYRRLWWPIAFGALLLAVLLLAIGFSHPVVERFRQGLLFQDLANQMRLAEFANARAIIARYPFFGVGLGQAPEIELSTGVSNLYLAIAEHMGLVGLSAFLLAVGGCCWHAWRRLRREDKETAAHRLSLLAGVVAALAVGTLDHYFFNLAFPHMAALLWIVLGLVTAPVRSQIRSTPDPCPGDQNRL